MKVLYITHSGNLVYGAAKSLGFLLRNQTEHFDLMCSDYLFQNSGEEAIRLYAGSNLDKLYHFKLPNQIKMLRMSGKYTFIHRMIDTLREVKQNIGYYLCKTEIYKVIEEGEYDLIHLNSIVLHKIIRKKENYLLHVREVCSDYGMRSFSNKLKLARGVICIDQAVLDYLPYTPQNHIILNNPFDMMSVNAIDKDEVAERFGLGIIDELIVFSILGVISESKGIDFLIRAFKDTTQNNARLLIVGKGTSEYIAFCRSIADDDKRIIFAGEINDTESVYAITDYVVRADPFFATGRTVYEGLYAGCNVILQGKSSDLAAINEYASFADRITFYTPRDISSCVKAISNAIITKPHRQTARSNIKEYVQTFNDWLKG